MKKGRIWASVGYPESLPIDYIDQLEETGLKIAISPLHNKDLNPDGTTKKEHRHFIFVYDGPTTYKHVKEITDKLKMTIPIKLESLRGMYRYHIHIDNPEKYQYDDRDRILLGGFDPKEVNALTTTEVDKITTEILEFIDDNEILEYSDLLHYFRINDLTNMLDVSKKHTILFNTYIKSKRHKKKEEKEKIKLTIDK